MKILGKKRVDKDFLEISVSQFISITCGVIAGIGLLSFIDKLVLIPGLLIMLPGFLEMHGNISGSLAARISVLLHTNKIKPKHPNHLIKENVNASIFLFIITSIILGLLAFVITYLLFGVIEYNLLYIILFATLITVIIEIPITVLTTLWLFRHDYEPDDIMGPYITTIGDIISIISLSLAVIILL